MRSTRDFFIGTLTGLTIGLLAAPSSGQESRRRLKQEYDKRMQSSGGPSSGGGLKEQLTTAFEQIKEQVNNYIGQKKSHEQRMSDTGHFDYQSERMNKFTDQNPTSPVASSTLVDVNDYKA
ncbi:YtxH domain-containing protein [Spirosoma arcticum]